MVKLIVYDFDGVLTDNRVWVTEDGKESVACNRSDGWWIKEITRLGVEQVILSTEKNPVVGQRARKLGLEVVQGAEDKKAALLEILSRKGVSPADVCYVGNEVNDLECMKVVGYPFAPKDSHADILKIAAFQLPEIGGAGVVKHLHKWLSQHRQEGPRASSGAATSPAPGNTENISTLRERVAQSIAVKQAFLEDRQAQGLVLEIANAAIQAIRDGRKIIFAGNGGSFADSMHLAAEFVSKLQRTRGPLASIALGCSNSNLTAIGNDYGYEFTFSREISAIGQAGDVFIAISTSGNSPNVLEAVRVAQDRGLVVFGLSGRSGGKLIKQCKTVCVPSDDTARIQECHILIGHVLCELVESPFV